MPGHLQQPLSIERIRINPDGSVDLSQTAGHFCFERQKRNAGVSKKMFFFDED